MEMIEMKKTIALLAALVLIAGTAFAAPTFSGNFGFDYKFSMDGDIATDGYDGTLGASDISLTISDDYYSVSLRNSIDGDAAFNSKDWYSTATLKVSEILKTIDVELPITLDALVGNQQFYDSSVYTDPNGTEGDYYDLYSDGIARDNIPFGVTVGYEDLGTVTGGYDLLGEGKFAKVVLTPMDGISLAANLASNANFGKVDANGIGLSASAAADIAAFADLDFDLAVSGAMWLAFDTDDINAYFAAVTGGKDAVSAYVEYTNEQTKSNMNIGGAYQINDAAKVSAGVGIADLGDDSEFGAYVKGTYTIAGITPFVKYGFSGNGDDAGEHYIQTGLDFSF